jgi:hypothetical protein
MNTEQLQHTLEQHKLWLRGEGGQKANLSGSDLSGSNLYGCDLREADLSGSNLRGCNLSGSNLRECNLRGCDLRECDLYGCNLREADLSGSKNIMQFGPMPTSGRIIYAVRHDSGWMLQAGCFWGSLEELEAEVKANHNCPMYLEIIQLLRNTTNQ